MRKTQLKILSILILSTLFTLISCNEDDFYEHNHNAKAGIKSKKITFNEFKNHIKAFNLVTEVNKKQSESSSTLNKIVKDTINNFIIETQEGLYLQYANLHSFTFPIHREVDNGKLENLVLSYQNDGSYKVKVLQYDLTTQERIDLENDQLKTIQNPIITIPIENFDTNLVVNGCETVTETIYVSCSSGEHSFGSGNALSCNYWNNLSSGNPPRVYTVSRIKCLDADGSSGGGGPIDGGFGDYPGGGGDADNNYPPEYPTPQTNPEEYEEGISTPVNPSLDGDLSIISDAENIKDLISLTKNKNDGTKTNIKTRIDQLNTARLTSIKENGYMFDSNQNVLPSYNQGSNWTAWANAGLTQYYITLHMHQDNYLPEGSTIPKPTNVAPSDTDVANLLLLLNQTNNKKVTSMLVNRLGTFAIRVNDKNKAKNAFNALTNPNNTLASEFFSNEYDRLVIKPFETVPLNDNAVMNGFIEFINTHLVNGQSMGLTFYQAVFDSQENIINWVKL